jgi:hypothetical protein
MYSMTEIVDSIITLLLLPTTLYGLGGAIVHAHRSGKPLRQSFIVISSGAFTAHMFSPAIIAHVPEAWHAVMFFLAGYGGVELVSRLYEAVVSAVEARIRRKIGDE